MSILSNELKKYQDEFLKVAPTEVKEIMSQATQNLETANISKNALQVGEIAKGFTLPNAVENTISLYQTLEENDYAILSFYRGQWCPYCNLELQALQGVNEEFKSLNAKLIAISPQSPDASISTVEKHELTFEVLSDSHNGVAKEYGLVFSLLEELRPIYESFGIDIPGLNEEDSYELPMPATYIINKNREIIYAYVVEDYTQRSEPQDILDAIKKDKKIIRN